MEERDIDGQLPTAKEVGHIREKDGDIRRATRTDCIACIGAHEEAAVTKSAGELLGDVRRGAVYMEVDNLNALEWILCVMLTSSGEGVDQHLWECIGSVDKHALARFNGKHGLLWAHEHVWSAFHSVVRPPRL